MSVTEVYTASCIGIKLGLALIVVPISTASIFWIILITAETPGGINLGANVKVSKFEYWLYDNTPQPAVFSSTGWAIPCVKICTFVLGSNDVLINSITSVSLVDHTPLLLGINLLANVAAIANFVA